jgi:lipid-A-disaccharide synthase
MKYNVFLIFYVGSGVVMTRKKVMIIAGETSGDIHGAKLISAMKQKDSSVFFGGIGGNDLKEAGVKIMVDASTLSVVGITEVFSRLPTIFRGMRRAKELLKILDPDLLILIDFPDFNLRVAAAAKKLNIRVLYYISPQIWAWRLGRVKKIGRLVDHIAVILPFEEKFYKKHNIPVTYVGHPLLDGISDKSEKPNNIVSDNRVIDKKKNSVIGLLPGSRDKEIARHLPVMIEAAKILNAKMNNLKFILSVAPGVEKKIIEDIIARHSSIKNMKFSYNNVGKVFEQSCFVIAASGTVTLQAAVAGTPMVIIYKVSPVSYLLGKALIQVENIGLVNLIAGGGIVPELVQDQASPENIAQKTYEMLKDEAGLNRLQKKLLSIRGMLGGPGASVRVAEIAFNMMRNP